MYILAILLPPLATLFSGKPLQAIVSVGLCFLFWIPAVIYATSIVSERRVKKRREKEMKLVKALMAA